MTPDDLMALFEKHSSEYRQFERIENPTHKRPDLCAFVRLDQLVPGDREMVSAVDHDEIYLGVDLEKMAGAVTEADVIFLCRCGVSLNDLDDGLSMFV